MSARFEGETSRVKVSFCLIQTRGRGSEFEHCLMSIGSHSPIFFTREFFSWQERIVLYHVIFLLNTDGKKQASAGEASHAKRYLMFLENVLTVWSEIALDLCDDVANDPYTQ